MLVTSHNFGLNNKDKASTMLHAASSSLRTVRTEQITAHKAIKCLWAPFLWL